ncbi:MULTISPECIES: hypothetical protein [Methanococcoides]|nr:MULTISPECIES: hypothetical protein [Methanococcoides]MBC2693741.1 hypothetical protein [Desulfobacteraceae bacterium]MBC2718053.1 hypothetical protein [Desulfobacteraceae bacterium]
MPYKHAAPAAGISYQTFRNWMKGGENAKSGQYKEFYEAIKWMIYNGDI